MGPLLFEPDLKERIWGGEKLKNLYGKKTPFKYTGESWEVACHEHGASIIATGPYKGRTLCELLQTHSHYILGEGYEKGNKFPLLVKIIDAKEDLSVQVHPDDTYAKIIENGELGKSEAWVVMEADEGARLIIGLKKGTTQETFIDALGNNQLEQVLNEVEVKPGDVFNIPAGLIHAIGKGILLAEVQQNSDTTYRVYDWNRIGLDGQSRDLHIDKSKETIDFLDSYSTLPIHGSTVVREDAKHTYYILNQYFALETIEIDGSDRQLNENSYEIYMVLEGFGQLEGDFESLEVKKGDSLLIPATCIAYTFTGKMKLLKTYVPSSVKGTLKKLEVKGVQKEAIMIQ
ncbi:MAG: mannose-6-phosphate isomerase [Firmicutes bacterium HGW-Firmicutes-5]|nr:MAG: mannose-6-phosphate isomerase [Firmicutes bacterium HGW-Firmicutes-5]